ncbi:MAG: SDR family oxidoreductase [Thiolinea sp.]
MTTAFKDKSVLITGGGSGTGADMALAFAQAGAEVIISGRRQEALDRVAAQHAAIRTVVADVSDEAQVETLFGAAGTPDIVIANAGIADSNRLVNTPLEQWNRILAVNLTGVFLTFRAGLRALHGKPWGRLIAVASIAGLRGHAYASAYAASKHGVLGLVRSTALETAQQGITVNAVCPAYLDTEMTAQTIANVMDKTGRSREQVIASLCKHNPQGRLIAASEVTATVLWLCSEGAASINGQAITLDGGQA